MAELIVKIDLEKERIFELIENYKKDNPDIVEVVRCIYCRKFGTSECFKKDSILYTDMTFCSEGEPKEEQT